MHDKVIVQEDLTKQAYELSMRAHRAYRMIFFVLGIVEAFLLIRFFFKLFAANPQSWFVAFIYWVSGVLLIPFWGIFRNMAPTGPGITRIFEPSTIVAAIIYVLLAWGLSRLLLITQSKPLDGNDQ